MHLVSCGAGQTEFYLPIHKSLFIMLNMSHKYMKRRNVWRLFKIIKFKYSIIKVVLVLALLLLSNFYSFGNAARSTTIIFTNKTNFSLFCNKANLAHGIWRVYFPQIIQPGQTVSWTSESNGIMTGTEGVTYFNIYDVYNKNAQVDGSIVIYWNNPYVGNNSCNLSAPPSFGLNYQCSTGENNTINVIAFQQGPVSYVPLVYFPHEKISTLQLRIVTANTLRAGTDNMVYFGIGPMNWPIDGAGSNLEQGTDQIYNLSISDLELYADDIVIFEIEKKGLGGYYGTTDFPDGEWHLLYIELIVNGDKRIGRLVNQVIGSPNNPFWSTVIQTGAVNDPISYFARTLRMKPNSQEIQCPACACATTKAKRAGISGWIQKGAMPKIWVQGRVLWTPTLSADGLATIDIEIGSINIFQGQPIITPF